MSESFLQSCDLMQPTVVNLNCEQLVWVFYNNPTINFIIIIMIDYYTYCDTL